MKQHITEKQWAELEQKQMTIFCDAYKKIHENPLFMEMSVTIGMMIEFLGDDLVDITRPKDWKIDFNKTLFFGKELCDALWSACCYKLKQ